MEISIMQEVGHIYWDDNKLAIKEDFSYDTPLDFSFSPDDSSLWNPSSEFCSIEENTMLSIEENTVLSNETQNDVMEFAFEDELLDSNDDLLWDDLIVEETELLCPCPQKELFSEQENSAIIEHIPCVSQHDSDLSMFDLDFRNAQDGGEDFSCLSSETANTSTSGEPEKFSEIIIPCEIDSSEYKGLRIVHLLTACAEAASNGALELVDVLLERLKEIASPTGSTMERVAYYLSQSLQQTQMEKRLQNSISNGVSRANFLGAFILLNQAYPFIKIAHFTANQSILEAIPLTRQQTVHIIDFDIMDGMQWPSLMEALKNEDYQIDHLKITAVKWVDSFEDSDPSSSYYKDTGRRLSDYSISLGIPFSFQETEIKNLQGMISSSKEDEIVVVNCMWELPNMFERSRKKLVDFINGAHQFNPVILTLGTGANGISGYENLTFMERFSQCLRNLCAMFDSLEAGLGEQYGLARAMVEHLFFGPMMCRPINYMANDELFRVIDIPLKLGFVERAISQKSFMHAKALVSCNEIGRSYGVESAGNGQLLLNWDMTPLTCVSAWSRV
ncbi:scarecrow-like protein 26 [Cryptomeria japonica]|uniref:scarecrow-like protein 26 n=1 Tax=Cryptomeria japonica TaxID=3369 RepID=UPI0027DAB093|nr:scarecrow-like protein 26 [Cryptomeria japonica]